MQLDLNSVDSIVAWWRVWPARHDSYLDYKLHASPEFAHAIRAARRRIAANPELRALQAQSLPPPPAWRPWAEPGEAVEMGERVESSDAPLPDALAMD